MVVLDVPVQRVLFTVFQSIFEVFLLCLAGFTLSFTGIIDKPTSKVLNHINIALFTPALLFSKVAFFLSPAKLRQLWVIPIFFVLLTILSALIARCLARACRLKRSQVNFATAASMFMNSNSLPVALMQSLASTVPILKWGSDDTVDAMFGRSLTYLVVFSTLGMMLRWSYGIRLLSQADEPEPPPPKTYRDADDYDQRSPLIRVTVSRSTEQLPDCGAETALGPRSRPSWRTLPFRPRTPHARTHAASRHPNHSYTHSHSHLPAVPTSLGDQSESDDSDEMNESDSEDTLALRSEPIDTGFSTEVEDHTPTTLPPSECTPRWGQPARSIFVRFHGILTSLSPPLFASVFALFCVLVPPVQRVLNSDGMVPFKGALDSAGACSVPLTLIVLGGWFWDEDLKANKPHGLNEEAKINGQGKGKNKGKGTGKDHVIRYAHHIVPPSHDSSTTSLPSMIGTFGSQAKWSGRGRVHARAGDVEPNLLGMYTESDVEAPRSRSWPDPMNGHARCSSTYSSSSVLPVPTPDKHSTTPPGETLTVLIVLFARMVLVPLVSTPMLVLVRRLGWGGEVFEDPVFIVSSMLLVSSPPALTLAQVSQRVKANNPTPNSAGANATPDTADTEALSPFERLLSRTVFWSYLVLTPPVTIASVMVGLLLIGA